MSIKKNELVEQIQQQLAEKAQSLLQERIKIVNRVRKGEVQRNKRVSAKDGFSFKDGKLTKMSPSERRNRSLSQKKAARKRRGKLGTALRNRKISMRKSERLPQR